MPPTEASPKIADSLVPYYPQEATSNDKHNHRNPRRRVPPAVPLSASDLIRPYKESGKSGHFSYAIYNNRWLLHGQRALDEKHITRVAITGVLPGAKGEIAIPSSIEGHEVYGIDDKALESCLEVTAIAIPKTVRFLQPGTLNRCRGLERHRGRRRSSRVRQCGRCDVRQAEDQAAGRWQWSPRRIQGPRDHHRDRPERVFACAGI